jgi:hypothetical protein
MFRDTLDAALRQSVQLTSYLRDITLLHQWVVGQGQMMSLLEDEEEWEDNDRVYCSIAHVLRLESCSLGRRRFDLWARLRRITRACAFCNVMVRKLKRWRNGLVNYVEMPG